MVIKMNEFIEILKFIVLGIIQGVAEVFPVSSSGHLSIFSKIFGVNQDSLTIFLMITNAGSFLALLIFFRKKIIVLIKNSYSYIFRKKTSSTEEVIENKESFTYVLKLLIAAIPIGIAGLLFKNHLEAFDSLVGVGVALIVTSVLLFIIFMIRNINFTNTITYKRALVIGLFQAFAVFPGISRSGITIFGGLTQKVKLKEVLNFTFLCYIIVSVPVTILGIIDCFNTTEEINILGYSLAFIFSFAATLATIKVLFKAVSVKNLLFFSIYCLLIGVTACILAFV